MRCPAPVFLAPIAAILVFGCESKTPVDPTTAPQVPSLAKGGPGGGTTEFATRTALPALVRGTHGEAYAVNRAGSLIGGYSWDQQGLMHPVTWSLVSGSWKITAYQWDGSATSAVIRALNDQGDKAGQFFPASAPRPVLWNPAGAFTVLGCNELGAAYGLSASAQVAVGGYNNIGTSSTPKVWRPGQCGETLPSLSAGAGGFAYAANGDGTIVGGTSAAVPVRWKRVNNAWQVEQLDSRQGTVFGANAAGDLVGAVGSNCQPGGGCTLDIGIVWFVNGGSRVLPTLGGPGTAARAINSAREVVGLGHLANGDGVPIIWSETLGIRQLPLSNGGWAFAISDVRADGTRIVAGAGGQPFSAQVWVVRSP